MELSAPERWLLDISCARFGEQLTRLLTAGLGEENVGQRWRFTITYKGTGGRLAKRYVEAISHEPEDAPALLPRGRDPLVLLALLQLLEGGVSEPRYTLTYDLTDVLSILGWGDTSEARAEIDGAIRRYFFLMFSWKMGRAELACEGLAFYTAIERVVSECEVVNEGREDQRRVLNRVIFNSNFVERMTGARLFGVDWNCVSSVSRVMMRDYPTTRSA